MKLLRGSLPWWILPSSHTGDTVAEWPVPPRGPRQRGPLLQTEPQTEGLRVWVPACPPASGVCPACGRVRSIAGFHPRGCVKDSWRVPEVPYWLPSREQAVAQVFACTRVNVHVGKGAHSVWGTTSAPADLSLVRWLRGGMLEWSLYGSDFSFTFSSIWMYFIDPLLLSLETSRTHIPYFLLKVKRNVLWNTGNPDHKLCSLDLYKI